MEMQATFRVAIVEDQTEFVVELSDGDDAIIIREHYVPDGKDTAKDATVVLGPTHARVLSRWLAAAADLSDERRRSYERNGAETLPSN